MEDNKLENILEAYKNKTGESWLADVMLLNMNLLEILQIQKTRTKLNKLAAFKILTIIGGLLWIFFLACLLYQDHLRNIIFTVSVSIIILFNVAAIVVYARQIILIRRINYSGTVTGTQQKLTLLQLSTINIVRLLFLQMPFYCTLFWNPAWINLMDSRTWLITFPVILLFASGSVWLYKNISLKNANRKWFKLLFGSIEWTAIIRSMEYIKLIDDFKEEPKDN